MKKRGNEAASRILGFMVMPVLAGMLFGSYLAFRIYSGFIENVEASCIDEVSVNYGHPITIGDFFTDVPKNARFITNVSQIDTGILASYDVAIDCDGHVMHSILNVVDLTGPAAVAAAAKAVKVDASGLNADLHGSPAYRAHLVSVMAARAVDAAG